ncbi:MAG: hypothetical protein ACK4TC_11265 [Sphingomonas pseudosanguinis]|uniref:hypothetical protein n=1 Tax=Sphingomonas pseudosanguinis TaxID=413712 RepID=UPI00391DAADF
MGYFVVAYDLKCRDGERRDYGPLIDALTEMDSCHTQKTVWYVSRDCSTIELRDDLKQYVEERDLLMVVRFTVRPRWTKGMEGTSDWLKRHGFT